MKSSCGQFWVIVGYMPAFIDSPPFVIGVFFAYEKPEDCNEFLGPLVEEALGLSEIGFNFRGRCVELEIAAFICDAPARAMITCTKSHTSRLNGCSRCSGSGVTIGILKTNQTFRDQIFENHHNGITILERLQYLDMILDIPLDPMHLVDLGVMRRMLQFLFGTGQNGSIPNVTLNRALIRAIDTFLIRLRPFISRIDFARQPRTVKELPRWKATELRQFLHYLGVVIFKDILTPAFYEHFLCFHVAIKILSCRPWCFDDNDHANDLLVFFVRQSEALYSELFVTYNVHGLMHLAQDCLRFGPIDSYSAYRFENHYGDMKRHLRKNDKPLQQFIKRMAEREKNNFRPEINDRLEDGQVQFRNRHFDGPLVENLRGYQFREIECVGKWKLKCAQPDNCVMLNDSRVVIVENFVQFAEEKYIVGREFCNQQDFYLHPVPSSVLCEFYVSNLSPILQAWSVEHVKHKCVKLPTTCGNIDSFVVFPLIR